MTKLADVLAPPGDRPIEIGAWTALLNQPVRHTRRGVAQRLNNARRALASLRLSERNERQMLQRVEQNLRTAGAVTAVSANTAELMLEAETHISNLAAIGRQIALVRLAIEHLNRRATGWSPRKNKAEAENDNVRRGSAVIDMLRAERAKRLAASKGV